MKKPKSKFNFILTEYIDPHIIKLYIIILISILLTAIMVIIGVNIYRYGISQEELNKPPLYSEQDISSILKSPGLTDFIIPESLDLGGRGFVLYREPVKAWTDEMIKHYIIPPDELGIDKISEESRLIMERKLDDIP